MAWHGRCSSARARAYGSGALVGGREGPVEGLDLHVARHQRAAPPWAVVRGVWFVRGTTQRGISHGCGRRRARAAGRARRYRSRVQSFEAATVISWPSCRRGGAWHVAAHCWRASVHENEIEVFEATWTHRTQLCPNTISGSAGASRPCSSLRERERALGSADGWMRGRRVCVLVALSRRVARMDLGANGPAAEVDAVVVLDRDRHVAHRATSGKRATARAANERASKRTSEWLVTGAAGKRARDEEWGAGGGLEVAQRPRSGGGSVGRLGGWRWRRSGGTRRMPRQPTPRQRPGAVVGVGRYER